MMYTILNVKQGSEEWLRARNTYTDEQGQVKYRITASDFGTVCGLNKFKTLEELIREKKEGLTPEPNQAMIHGMQTEPEAREWYRNKFQKRVQEVGLAVSTEHLGLGASVDGLVLDDDHQIEGMIEIKCPQNMYAPLVDPRRTPSSEDRPDKEYIRGYENIWPTHFCQIQGCLGILGLPWCDYVVYASGERKIFVRRIPYVQKYWTDFLKPRLLNFLKTL